MSPTARIVQDWIEQRPLVIETRRLSAMRLSVGVGFDARACAWFVYDRHDADPEWMLRAGPHATRAQAEASAALVAGIAP